MVWYYWVNVLIVYLCALNITSCTMTPSQITVHQLYTNLQIKAWDTKCRNVFTFCSERCLCLCLRVRVCEIGDAYGCFLWENGRSEVRGHWLRVTVRSDSGQLLLNEFLHGRHLLHTSQVNVALTEVYVERDYYYKIIPKIAVTILVTHIIILSY